jgi:hypothetical protein
MIEIVIGDYLVKKNDVVVSKYDGTLIRKHSLAGNTKFVLFGEEVGLKKKDIQFLVENSTNDIVIVFQDDRPIKGLRNSKRCSIIYDADFVKEMNPFDLVKSFFTVTDRDYIYEFLCKNKVNLFMPVKALTSCFFGLSKENLAVVAWLDLNLFKCRPEILYGVIAYHLKPNPYFRFVPWLFPKKKKENTDD